MFQIADLFFSVHSTTRSSPRFVSRVPSVRAEKEAADGLCSLQTFMSANQVTGLHTRLEGSRKYLFGNMLVYGTANNSKIM